jgi:hypothetical protein
MNAHRWKDEEEHTRALLGNLPQSLPHEPPPGYTAALADKVWEQIKQQPKPRKIFSWPMGIAASMLLAIGVGLWLFKPVETVKPDYVLTENDLLEYFLQNPDDLDEHVLLAMLEPELEQKPTMTLQQETEKIKEKANILPETPVSEAEIDALLIEEFSDEDLEDLL